MEHSLAVAQEAFVDPQVLKHAGGHQLPVKVHEYASSGFVRLLTRVAPLEHPPRTLRFARRVNSARRFNGGFVGEPLLNADGKLRLVGSLVVHLGRRVVQY